MSWTTGPLVGFDTETTGIDTARDRIVTAAIIHDDGAGTLTTHTWLLNPGVEIPTRASAVHGITTAMAQASGVPPAPALAEIAQRLADALAAGIPIVAFNAAFDLSLLERELCRYELPTLSSRGELCPVIDPLVLDRVLDRYRRGKRRLADLAAVYGLAEPEGLHTAEVDVALTLGLIREMGQRYEQLAVTDPLTLHRHQIGWHREWAEDFNAWRERKGLSGPGANLRWPLDFEPTAGA
ncbi:MAG: exonuclease domain-containing protein [Bowdeniella nasicola]|nr:exonuclease domain-containing protein [Bowdeniella nasicola]